MDAEESKPNVENIAILAHLKAEQELHHRQAEKLQTFDKKTFKREKQMMFMLFHSTCNKSFHYPKKQLMKHTINEN